MNGLINIYCDESCHLENDRINVMVLGSVICPEKHKINAFKKIRDLKETHGFNRGFEIKWTKVSENKKAFYLDLIDYFLTNDNLGFRALIVPDKSIIKNGSFNQTYEDFYYKMYYQMLKGIVNPRNTYNIFVDIKDTNGAKRRQKLQEVLNKLRTEANFQKQLSIKTLQAVRSHEVELIQLADLLTGAVCYINRALTTSSAKLEIIEKIKQETGYPLTATTFLSESKFNLFKIRLQNIGGWDTSTWA